jgi:hypothetical protein
MIDFLPTRDIARHKPNRHIHDEPFTLRKNPVAPLCSKPRPFVNSPMPRILFVSGFHPSTRARDLAFEFER